MCRPHFRNYFSTGGASNPSSLHHVHCIVNRKYLKLKNDAIPSLIVRFGRSKKGISRNFAGYPIDVLIGTNVPDVVKFW